MKGFMCIFLTRSNMAKAEVQDEGGTDGHDVDSKIKDKAIKELAEIRQRRLGGGRRFLTNIEDYVLFGGFTYGTLFALLLFSMSSGMLGNSTTFDHAASKTFLDSGDECLEITDEPWLQVYLRPDVELFSISGHNLPEGFALMKYSIFETFEDAEDVLVENHTNTSLKVVNHSDNPNGRAYFKAPYNELGSGEYKLRFYVDVYDQRDWVNGSLILELNKTTTFEVDISKKAFAFLPFVDNSESKDIRITDAGARPCWSVQDLGDWAYLLMGAELGGGRETAMLTGGAAGVPAWWMAFISLSLSVISLLILYPIMYKVYHQDTDDILSRNHIEQLVRQIVETSSHRMHINIDWDLFKIQIRELSVDILIAYQNTEGTLTDSKDIRAEILREILEEFALFRVFKPVQLTVKLIGQSKLIDFDSGVGIGSVDEDSSDQDYSSFFSELHSLSRIEDDVRDSLDLFFTRRADLSMKGAIVTSDDKIVFVSVIYRPMQRLAFFRFKKTSEDIKDELYAFISNRNEDILGSQELVVKTRNEISTLADRSGAGRIERRTTNQDDDRLVAVARQDGLGGRMLQTKFLGDTLSTVEYMANEKREMINKWGFWGLIVFVWIPFMASGVLVGAMLGLLSRMKFMRVLAATFVGGAAASITWAYTAEGIVKFMHNYKLEAVIPIMIIVFILMAVLHIRSTKMRRQTELFEDTLLDNFQADITAKYGDQ